MNTCAELFIANLKSKDLSYEVKETDDAVIVAFPYRGRKTNLVFSGNDGRSVQLMTFIESVPEDKYMDVLLACNKANARFRFVKFAIDPDDDLMVFSDGLLDVNSAGDECLELLARTLYILKDAKPALMNAIFG